MYFLRNQFRFYNLTCMSFDPHLNLVKENFTFAPSSYSLPLIRDELMNHDKAQSKDTSVLK